jgi:N-methylhydantoinase A
VDVEIPAGPLGPGRLDAITAAFEAAYRLLYSRTPQGVPLEALNWRAVVSGPRPDILRGSVDGGSAGTASRQSADGGSAGAISGPPQLKSRRRAYFPEARGYVETPVYDRYALGPGARLEGPAIVEERESTTVIGPGTVITVDMHRTLIAEPAAAGAR